MRVMTTMEVVMRAVVSIVMIGALGVAGSASSAHTASGVGRPVACQAQTDQVTVLRVEGMTWTGCEAAVVQAAKSVEGVKSCKANHKTGTAEVTYDPAKTTPEAVAQVIAKKTGFKTTVPKRPRL